MLSARHNSCVTLACIFYFTNVIFAVNWNINSACHPNLAHKSKMFTNQNLLFNMTSLPHFGFQREKIDGSACDFSFIQ